MPHFLSRCAFAVILLALSLPAVAEVSPAQSAGSPAPSTVAFEKANEAMHHGMMIDYTGNADIDFVRGMIPHHQGAIDMAKILLAHGKDPELQKLGHEIIAAQTKEIAQMQAWLAKHDNKAAKPTK